MSLLTNVIAALSLFWAAHTYYDNVQLQKELAAATLYREHMITSLENANLANSEIAPKSPNKSTSANIDANVQPPTKSNSTNNEANAQSQYLKDTEAYEKYRWYVGHALYSFETMIEIVDEDPGWTNTFQDFICDHEKYIRSTELPHDHYSDKLKNLIKATSPQVCDEREKKRRAQPIALTR